MTSLTNDPAIASCSGYLDSNGEFTLTDGFGGPAKGLGADSDYKQELNISFGPKVV